MVTVPQKIARSGIEENTEPVVKILFTVEDNAHHIVRHGEEKIVIRRCKVRRILRMLKDLPFEFMDYGFDDLCNTGPGVIVEESNTLFHVVYLGYLERFVDPRHLFRTFPNAPYFFSLTKRRYVGLLWHIF